VAAVMTMGSVLPHKGNSLLEMAILVVFSALFAWVSIGFWTATFGFFTLMRRFDRLSISRDLGREDEQVRPGVRTAVLFPVCNEDVDRVMAGIAATYRSIEKTGQLSGYDLFILSDTRDPDAWVAEEAAWKRTCDELGAHGRLFYRRRKLNLRRKSGNVADFCRRFGASYTYMVVMDADSVMSGRTLNRMVRLMEHKRHVGILQTAPAVAGRNTLLARVQQFANRAYGPMFAAGLHFMQLGDAQYWGHNAIIRIRPFMEHCALPRLSGRPPLGGEILSHDFVEAATDAPRGLGRLAGVRHRRQLRGGPPEPALRTQAGPALVPGQHAAFAPALHPGAVPGAPRALPQRGHGVHFGIPLVPLPVLSSAEAMVEALLTPQYFPSAGMTLFPEWPVWQPGWALGLLATTGVILFLPKLESYLLIVLKGRDALFGGRVRLLLSILSEILVSSFLAPIRMLFHSKFVFSILMGREAGWGSQQRDDTETPWSEAIRFHAGGPCSQRFGGQCSTSTTPPSSGGLPRSSSRCCLRCPSPF
jgi:membrane glycosyltransferase